MTNFANHNVAAHKSGRVTVTAEGVRTGCAEGRRTVGVRSGNNANNGNLSARYLNANNSAGNTNSYYCGSAKVWHKKTRARKRQTYKTSRQQWRTAARTG